MGQRARFDDSEKARLVDDASIGVNDNPVVGEDSIERVRVIVGDRSGKFVFQFHQFFFHRIFEDERERDKPRLALNNITAGVREREDANRTREAGGLDEIQGVVANTLKLFRNGTVGLIVW